MKRYRKITALFMSVSLVMGSILPATAVLAAEADESVFSSSVTEEESAGTGVAENSADMSEADRDDDPREGIYTLSEYDEDAALGGATKLVEGYWHLSSDGELRYNDKPENAIDFSEVKENKEKVIKVVIESGPTSVNSKHKCMGFPNIEEVEYTAPVTIGDMVMVKKNMFSECPKLRKLTIGDYKPGNGLELERRAFKDCPMLSEIKFGKGMWHFGRRTFGFCTSLTTFNFPDDIHNVRADAFWGCTNLEKITLKNNQWMKEKNNTIVEYTDPHTKTRGSCFITPCLMFVPEGEIKKANGNYKVADDIKDIQYWSLSWLDSLKCITFPSGVESIMHEACLNDNNLETIYLPKTLKRVGQTAFGYKKLEGSAFASKEEDSEESEEGEDDEAPRPNPAIKDVYYEGSEADWKKIKLATYDLNEGHIDQMSIKSTTTLYDHLETAGIPSTATIHFLNKSGGSDMEPENDVVFTTSCNTVSFNAASAGQLSDMGADMEVKYTPSVSYNGKKHTLKTGDKPSPAKDVQIQVRLRDKNTGAVLGNYTIAKALFKNNKDAAKAGDANGPYFMVQVKARDAKLLSKEDKKALRALNKELKTNPKFRIPFTITPLDISGFTEKNYEGFVVAEKKGVKTPVFKKLFYDYKSADGNLQVKMKRCKNDDPSARGDYVCKLDGDKVKVTGCRNFTGSVIFTVK